MIYTYDAGNRVTSMVDSVGGTLTENYDGLDRLTSEISPQGTVSYQYDAASRRTQMTVAGQAAVNYGYDNADRLLSITQGSSSAPITYDNANRRSTLTLPNGIKLSYGYDNANELTGLTYTLGANPVGNLTYGYDSDGRIITRGGTLDVTNLPAALASASYDANNRLTNWGGQALSYDANGNLTGNGTNAFTWDTRNQLTAISGGTTASFLYDALGRRENKTIGSTSTNFLYDGLNLEQELNGTMPTVNYLTGAGIDETLSRTDSSGTASYLTDNLGSTLALTNSAGAISTNYSYEPYGNTTASGTSSTNTLQYTGRENDGDGLYYYRARYYSPVFSRFISGDPMGLLGGINNYAYVGGNPVNNIDPLGLCPTTKPSQKCLNALLMAHANTQALGRAANIWGAIQTAADANGIEPSLLAAIAIRESGVRNIPQSGGGFGAGVFQLDLGANPSVTAAQAYNISYSANFAASMLSGNMAELAASHPNLTPLQLLQATAASYNFGTGNISGNPNTIDLGTTGNNYGINVLNLMLNCFN